MKIMNRIFYILCIVWVCLDPNAFIMEACITDGYLTSLQCKAAQAEGDDISVPETIPFTWGSLTTAYTFSSADQSTSTIMSQSGKPWKPLQLIQPWSITITVNVSVCVACEWQTGVSDSTHLHSDPRNGHRKCCVCSGTGHFTSRPRCAAGTCCLVSAGFCFHFLEPWA